MHCFPICSWHILFLLCNSNVCNMVYRCYPQAQPTEPVSLPRSQSDLYICVDVTLSTRLIIDLDRSVLVLQMHHISASEVVALSYLVSDQSLVLMCEFVSQVVQRPVSSQLSPTVKTDTSLACCHSNSQCNTLWLASSRSNVGHGNGAHCGELKPSSRCLGYQHISVHLNDVMCSQRWR